MMMIVSAYIRCYLLSRIHINITFVNIVCIYVHLYTGLSCNITRNVEVMDGGVIATFSSGNPGTTFTCRLDANQPESCKYT